MDQNLKTIFDFILQNENMTADEKDTFSKAVKDVDKELSITTFKLDRTEKVKRTTAILLEETIEELEQKRKAVEAQNRELEIEAALERVRSTSLSMYNSQDLSRVVYGMFTELVKLDAQLDRCLIQIVNPKTLGITWYLTGKEGLLSNNGFFVQDNPYPSHQAYLEGWRIGRKKWHYLLAGEEKRSWDDFGFTQTGLAQLPDFIKADMAAVKAIHLTISSDDFGCLIASSLSPLSEAHANIVDRFTTVFNQTYTRFLDLQKAEAQAREAKIEAALERIRSRALAMHNSAEVGDVSDLLFSELEKMDINPTGFSIMVFDRENDKYELWRAKEVAHQGVYETFSIKAMYDKLDQYIPGFTDELESKWNSESPLFIAELSGKKRISFIEANREMGNYTEEQFENVLMIYPDPIFWHLVFFKHGWLGLIQNEQLPADVLQVIRRFADVFEFAHTRFLDLQKAEANAREAQIEASLERFRSRMLGMQKSSELEETTTVMYQQINALGIVPEGAMVYIVIIDKKTETAHQWIVSDNSLVIPPEGELRVPMNEHPQLIKTYEAWKRKEPLLIRDISGEEMEDFRNYFLSLPSFRQVKSEIDQWPDRMVWSEASFSNGTLGLIFTTPLPQATLDILVRFSKVFDLTYTRFLDIQNAEAQAREAQIEAALERVRSRSMAMHKSEELREVVAVLYEQIEPLGMAKNGCELILCNEQTDQMEFWHANPIESVMPECYYVSRSVHPFCEQQWKAWKEGTFGLIIELKGKTKRDFETVMFSKTDFKKIPEDIKKWIMAEDVTVLSHATMKYGFLEAVDVEPLSKDKLLILQRFAKVFEQSYTRFLDLQKAEAQAREAQIEAALERVRSRTMGMQRSDELQDAALLLFQQIEGLGLPPFACGFNIWDDDRKAATAWMGSVGGLQPPFKTDSSRDVYLPIYEAAQRGESLFMIEQSGKELEIHYDYLATIPTFRDIILAGWKRDGISVPTFQIIHCAYFTQGYLMFISFEPVPAYYDIFKRFAKVFEQTYTRFLDLQKAEAQAREAQIEASLERLRSKTMAMHNSHDVGESVATMFNELERLEVKTKRCGVLIHGNSAFTEVWTARSNSDGKAALIIGHLDMTIHPMLSGVRDSWLNKESSFTYELAGEDIKNYFQAINDSKNYPYHFNINTLPSKEFHNDFHFRDGSIFAFTAEPIPAEALLIFNRFGGVFGQTYRRYLDLQKAETQAREAQIEAALERVRGKAMAMHSSEDLAATIGVFYRELEQFSITPRRCGVGLLQKNRIAELSTMNTMEYGNSIEIIGKLKMEGHWVLNGVYDNWILQKEFHPVLRGNEIKEYNQLLRPQVAFPEYPNDSAQFGYFFFFPEGGVYAWTEKEMKEDELKIYRRFTTVLSLTYKRYKDLKDAEANALEAVRRASLDRVRAEIASMRTVDDLQRITPIIWHELVTLNVPFVRCGVFIMNETTEHVQVYLSTPDGRSLAALDLPFNSSELTLNSVTHWRQGIIFKTHWDKQEFLNFMQSMIKLGQVSNQKTYQGAAQPPESLHLHFVPFKQGMLYVGNTSPLEKEALELVKALAESFSIAYARYEDFRQLESAKNQIEKTFTELKAAQAQLIQAEKMASLGELTAGIAHEIQNPLNFVNNFSEISNELVDEMKEELEESSRQYAAGNRQSGEERLKLAEEIAGDIKQNLEKINHHGKRAADIVKGMLQHSRTSSGQKEPTDINALADEYLRLAYHGLRAKDKTFNADFKTDFDESLPKINVIPQDIGRVLLNLINNAFYAVDKRAKSIDPLTPEGGTKNDQIKFVPTVTICTTSLNPPSGGRGVRIVVKDNGDGIPPHIIDKIFQPFFTTKPTGQGTGLGLSLAYDIVKAHGGELKVETKVGEGTEFIIQLTTV